jgi:azurin
MEAIYVSVWDGDVEIRTKCEYNPVTRDVTDIESVEANGVENLDDEYVELPDGSVIQRIDFTIDGED